MKKLVVIGLLAFVGVASAGGFHHGRHWHHHHHSQPNWVPFVLGAATGAVLYDIYNRPIVVQPQPVVVQPQTPIVYQQNCTAWVQTQNADGSTTVTRTCTP